MLIRSYIHIAVVTFETPFSHTHKNTVVTCGTPLINLRISKYLDDIFFCYTVKSEWLGFNVVVSNFTAM